MAPYCEQRSVIRLGGRDVRAFLQGLVTNDIDRLDDGPLYAAMLTPQGKLIAEFHLEARGEDILLDVNRDCSAQLVQRLSMYKLRADVTVEATDLCVSRGTGTKPSGASEDPRAGALGWRLISNAPVPEDAQIDWDAAHVDGFVPRWGAELGPDSYILEMGFERLNGVDFKKGCYVGQEVTARMKHKTDLRKGIARVELDGAAEPGTHVIANGKTIGWLGTRAGDRALAYLRFDRVAPDMRAGEARITAVTRPED